MSHSINSVCIFIIFRIKSVFFVFFLLLLFILLCILMFMKENETLNKWIQKRIKKKVKKWKKLSKVKEIYSWKTTWFFATPHASFAFFQHVIGDWSMCVPCVCNATTFIFHIFVCGWLMCIYHILFLFWMLVYEFWKIYVTFVE